MTGWARVPLGEISELVDYGVTASATNAAVGPKFLRITDIQNGVVDWDSVPWCACDAETAAASTLVSGDIVFARTGATTGKSFLVRECPPNTVFASYLIRLRLRQGIDPRFIGHFFQTPDYWAQITKSANGVAQAGVNASTLKALRIPIPSLHEQRRIAEILDKADALRAKRRAAIAQLDKLTQSIFLDMFGDPISRGWPMTTVADVVASAEGAIRTGPFGSQLLHSEFTDDGVAVLGIDNVVQNEFRWGQKRFVSEAKYRQLSRYTVHPGDVLITIMGTCGRCAIVPDDIPTAINTKHLCCITLDRRKCLPVFLHAYFLGHSIARRYLARKAKGAIMEGLNMGIIRELPVPLVSIELQARFEERVKGAAELRKRQCHSDAEFEALFGSLQYRAFHNSL